MVSCRPLSDAEERLHEAAKNGKCDEIKELAAGGTDMSCPYPNYVRRRLIHGVCMQREVDSTWPSDQPTDLLRRMTTMQLGT